MGWSYNFWRGTFYPSDLESKSFLNYYSKHLGSVEVDNTFYRIPRDENVTDWRQQTTKDFVFSLKFPQKITHMKMLRDAMEETNVFLEHVRVLNEKLGVLLLQFPPAFKQIHIPILSDYLAELPRDLRYAVEVRNKSLLSDQVYSLLRDYNVALVWVDAAKMPPITEVTADFLYVRWVGDRKTVSGTLGKIEVDRTMDIRKWADRLKPFANGTMEIFGYFSKYYSGNPVLDAEVFLNNMAT
jgi:uncharacterized protein YecE (DUF72 family)